MATVLPWAGDHEELAPALSSLPCLPSLQRVRGRRMPARSGELPGELPAELPAKVKAAVLRLMPDMGDAGRSASRLSDLMDAIWRFLSERTAV